EVELGKFQEIKISINCLRQPRPDPRLAGKEYEMLVGIPNFGKAEFPDFRTLLKSDQFPS
ncbi:MAG: hypothetical protein ABIH22_02845, partial [Candidatus Margulisiibacteriota bacterium]